MSYDSEFVFLKLIKLKVKVDILYFWPNAHNFHLTFAQQTNNFFQMIIGN